MRLRWEGSWVSDLSERRIRRKGKHMYIQQEGNHQRSTSLRGNGNHSTEVSTLSST
jgi:hypothetical protein